MTPLDLAQLELRQIVHIRVRVLELFGDDMQVVVDAPGMTTPLFAAQKLITCIEPFDKFDDGFGVIHHNRVRRF